MAVVTVARAHRRRNQEGIRIEIEPVRSARARRRDVDLAARVVAAESDHRQVDASPTSAVIKRGGNVFCRFAARRRIPAAAFADSQYLRGTLRVSKTADNEHAPAPLGDSEESRVQYAPGDAIPELRQPQKYSMEVASVVGAKESGNILDECPGWPQLGQYPLEFKPQTAALTPKTGPSTGHADVLAGEPTVDEIRTGETSWRSSQPFSVGAVSVSDHVSASSGPCGRVHFANVIDTLRMRPVPRENAQAQRVLLHLEHGVDACPFESNLKPAHAAEQREGFHSRTLSALAWSHTWS